MNASSTIRSLSSSFFFFNDTATTEIYTLSLHDALPICRRDHVHRARRPRLQLEHAARRALHPEDARVRCVERRPRAGARRARHDDLAHDLGPPRGPRGSAAHADGRMPAERLRGGLDDAPDPRHGLLEPRLAALPAGLRDGLYLSPAADTDAGDHPA